MDIPDSVRILRITQGIKFDDFGHAIRTKLIDYKVGADGPFTLEVAPANDTPTWIAAQITNQANQINDLRGGA